MCQLFLDWHERLPYGTVTTKNVSIGENRPDDNPSISASQKRYMKRFARWTKGYATRLNPLNRMDTVLTQFRGLQDSEHLDDAWDSLDEQESEARIA